LILAGERRDQVALTAESNVAPWRFQILEVWFRDCAVGLDIVPAFRRHQSAAKLFGTGSLVPAMRPAK
jgi:hypothetical protein